VIEAIDGVLRGNPIALLFVILSAGYLIGKTNIRGFELGPVTGVLFAGLSHRPHVTCQVEVDLPNATTDPRLTVP
jgi:uncharacterized transporter YbjL